MMKTVKLWRAKFPQLPLWKKVLVCIAAVCCAVVFLIGLLLAIIAVFLLVLALQSDGITWGGRVDSYMQVPFSYRSSLWVSEDETFAFVTDSGCASFGLMDGEDSVLSVYIAHQTHKDPKTVNVDSTGSVQWQDVLEASENYRSRERVYSGVVYEIDDDHVKMVFDMRGGEQVYILERRETLADENFRFEDDMIWPEEMLRWLEQQGKSE